MTTSRLPRRSGSRVGGGRTPIKQLFKHDPPHSYGDCYRTAVAYVLGMRPQDVPHFLDGVVEPGEEAEAAHDHILFWLRRRGLVPIDCLFSGDLPFADVARSVILCNPKLTDLCYFIGGESPRGCNHVVVCRGGEIVCDPAPAGGGLIGPSQPDGYWWVTLFGSTKAL